MSGQWFPLYCSWVTWELLRPGCCELANMNNFIPVIFVNYPWWINCGAFMIGWWFEVKCGYCVTILACGYCPIKCLTNLVKQKFMVNLFSSFLTLLIFLEWRLGKAACSWIPIFGSWSSILCSSWILWICCGFCCKEMPASFPWHRCCRESFAPDRWYFSFWAQVG